MLKQESKQKVTNFKHVASNNFALVLVLYY